MGTWVLNDTPRARREPDQEDHADQPTVKNDFKAVETVGGVLDAHAHGREQKGAKHHP